LFFCHGINRPTKSPASCGRLPRFGAISRLPAASLKSPAFLLDQCQVAVETLAFHFGQLILRKIVKIVATRCHILRLKWQKCTKFDFGRGSVPDRPLGELTAVPQTSELDLGGPTSNEREEGEVRSERGGGGWIWIWIVSRQGSVLEHYTDEGKGRGGRNGKAGGEGKKRREEEMMG